METSATIVKEDFLYMDIKAKIIDSEGLSRTVTRLAHEVIERNSGTSNVVIIGMKTRGDFLAQRIHKKIKDMKNCIREN